MASKSKKLFWAAVAIEIAASAWFGWQVATAVETPWARRPKASKLPESR